MKIPLRIPLVLIIFALMGCASAPVGVKPPSQPPNDSQIGLEEKKDDSTRESPQIPTDTVVEKTVPPPIVKKDFDSLDSDEKKILLDHFLKGALLERNQQFDEAGSEYSQALEILPDSSYMGALTSETLLKSGKVEDAIQIAQGIIQDASDETSAYRVLGDAYIQQQKWESAIEHYEKIVNLEPSSLDDWIDLANLYVRVQRFNDAITAFRKLELLDPAHTILYRFKVALLQSQLGRFEDSLKEYQSIIQLEPSYHEVYVRAGKIQELLGKNDDAIETYLNSLDSIRNNRDEMEVRSRLGYLFRQRGSLQEACYQYKRIKELDPDDVNTRLVLTYLFADLELYDDAFSEVNALTQKLPGNYRVASLRCQILENLDRKADGYLDFLRGFEKAVNNRMDEDVNLYLLDIFREQTLNTISEYQLLSDFKKLLIMAKEQIPEIPRISFAFCRVALFTEDEELLKQQLQSIIADLQKAKNDKNNDWIELICLELRSWLVIRNAFAEQGVLFNLVEALSQGEPETIDRPAMSWTLGVVYMDQKEWSLAESAFVKTLEKLDENTQSFRDVVFQLALVYDKENRIADIERLMKTSIETYPEDPQAYNFLGYTYADRNIHLDEALTLVEKAHKLSPEDGNIIDSLGWIYYRLGRYKEAIQFLRQASEKEENHPVILDHLADAYAQDGELTLALENWRKALEYGPDFPFEFTKEFESKIKMKIKEVENK